MIHWGSFAFGVVDMGVVWLAWWWSDRRKAKRVAKVIRGFRVGG